jgi:hypothetical protein
MPNHIKADYGDIVNTKEPNVRPALDGGRTTIFEAVATSLDRHSQPMIRFINGICQHLNYQLSIPTVP